MSARRSLATELAAAAAAYQTADVIPHCTQQPRHQFGTGLSYAEKEMLVEYLKTL